MSDYADVRGSFHDVTLSQRSHVVTTNCAQCVLSASSGQKRMNTRRTTKLTVSRVRVNGSCPFFCPPNYSILALRTKKRHFLTANPYVITFTSTYVLRKPFRLDGACWVLRHIFLHGPRNHAMTDQDIDAHASCS